MSRFFHINSTSSFRNLFQFVIRLIVNRFEPLIAVAKILRQTCYFLLSLAEYSSVFMVRKMLSDAINCV